MIIITQVVFLFSCSERYFYQKHLKDNYGDYHSKISYLSDKIAINQNDAEAYLERGRLYIGIGHYSKGIEDLDNAIIIKPDFGEAYLLRGYSKYNYFNYKKEMLDQAYDDANKMIELKYKICKAYLLRGRVQSFRNNYSDAIKDMDKAIEADINCGWAYYVRGQIKHDQYDDYNGSLSDLKKAKTIFNEEGDKLGYDLTKDLIKFIKQRRLEDKLFKFLFGI